MLVRVWGKRVGCEDDRVGCEDDRVGRVGREDERVGRVGREGEGVVHGVRSEDVRSGRWMLENSEQVLNCSPSLSPR